MALRRNADKKAVAYVALVVKAKYLAQKTNSVPIERRSVVRILLQRLLGVLTGGTNQKRLFLCLGREKGLNVEV